MAETRRARCMRRSGTPRFLSARKEAPKIGILLGRHGARVTRAQARIGNPLQEALHTVSRGFFTERALPPSAAAGRTGAQFLQMVRLNATHKNKCYQSEVRCYHQNSANQALLSVAIGPEVESFARNRVQSDR